MRKRTTTLHTPIAKIARATVLFSLLVLALSTQAEIPSVYQAEIPYVYSDTPLNVSTTDGSTPLGMAPGAPAGSFPLSGFESVNPYNGVLNFRLPLLHVGGRGSVQHVITVAVEHHWRVDKNKTGVGLGYVYDPNPDPWSTLDDPYCLGTMVGRRTGLSQASGSLVYCPDGASALTRLTFTTPDGTEFEFRDAPTNGAATANVYAPVGDPPAGCQLQVPQAYSRGRVFVTGDGSAATFISDTNIYEHSDTGDPQSLPADLAFPSGYLFLRDGTCYRIQDAKVAWIRDRNGNKISVEASTIKDSLNRQVNIATNLYDSASNRYYDEITYKGFNGTTTNGVNRRIRVWYRNLGECLRQPSFPPPAKSREFLFPPLDADNTPYNPRLVSEVELPDGRQYQLKYNWWGELARVDLPTGGRIEYDYACGIEGGDDSGVISSTIGGDLKKHIYRFRESKGFVLQRTT